MTWGSNASNEMALSPGFERSISIDALLAILYIIGPFGFGNKPYIWTSLFERGDITNLLIIDLGINFKIVSNNTIGCGLLPLTFRS